MVVPQICTVANGTPSFVFELKTLPFITPEFACPAEVYTALNINKVIKMYLFIKSKICTRNSKSSQIVQRISNRLNHNSKFSNDHFPGNQGKNALVFSIYSLYSGLFSTRFFSRRATPDTLIIKAVISREPRTGQMLPAARHIRP